MILRDLCWGVSLSLYETILMGDKWWWWKLHFDLWRAYRDWRPSEVLSQLDETEMLESLTYGEAPASSSKKALAFCHEFFPDAHTLTDLGAGRGVFAMTAALHGWDVIAVEYLQDFIRRSEPLARFFDRPLEWVQGNFLELPLPSTDIIHTSATAYPEDVKAQLADKFRREGIEGQGLLTQDWILEGERFEVLESRWLPVSWGRALFTLHRLR